MPNRARPTAQKREREKNQQAKRLEKLSRREDAKTRRAAPKPDDGDGTDPDLAGIKLGPQPPQDWQE